MNYDPYEDYDRRAGGWLCHRCGAFVGDVDLHNDWHARVARATRIGLIARTVRVK